MPDQIHPTTGEAIARAVDQETFALTQHRAIMRRADEIMATAAAELKAASSLVLR